jgi:hypothetical protein
MALYQVLYWQDIPAQLRAWDDFDEVRLELPPSFTARIDRSAQQQGLTGTEDYLAQWHWSEETERPGTPADVAESVRQELVKDSR